MIQCKSNYNAWFKVIAITVLCLFTLNNLVWANPDIFQKNSPYVTNDQNLAAMLGSVETSILTTVKAYVDSLGVEFFTESERHIFPEGPRGERIYLDSYPEIPANWEGDNFILNCRLGSAKHEIIVTPDGNVSLKGKADKQKEVVENTIDAAKAREPEQAPRSDLDHKQPSYLVHYLEQGKEKPLIRGLMSPLVLPHEIGNLIQALITGRWKDIKDPSWVNLFHGWVYKNKAPSCVGGILTSILTGVISLLFTNKFLMFYGMVNLIYAGMEITYFLIRGARSLKITGLGMDFASRSAAWRGINIVDWNKPAWFQEAFWRRAAAMVKSEKVKKNRINAEDWYYGATVVPWYEKQINKLKKKLSEEEINASLLKILQRVERVQLLEFSSAEERETADLVKQQAFEMYFELNTKRVNINPVFEYNPLTKTWEIDGKVTYVWENLLKEDADIVAEACKKAALAEAQGKPEAADLRAEARALIGISRKKYEEIETHLDTLSTEQRSKGPGTLLPGFAVLAFGGDEIFSMYTLGIVFGILLAIMILHWTYDTGRIQRFINKHPKAKGVLRSMFGADPEEQEISDILFRNAPIPFHVLDHEGRIIMVNQKWLETFGYKLHEVTGKRIFDFIIPEQRENAEQRFKARIRIQQIKQLLSSGKISKNAYTALARELAITKMPERIDQEGVKYTDRIYLSKDGKKIIAKTDDTITENKVITSFLDITDLRKAEDAKEDIARRDPGTGLYNLRHLRAELKEAIVRSETTKREVSLLLINLDDYEEIKKDTNRTFVAELAKTLGGQIQECLLEEKNGDAYTLAYIDSGLYAIIIRGNRTEAIHEKIGTLSRKIFRSLKHIISCGGEDYTYRGSVSMGAAVVPDDGNTEEELIHNADVALQESKKRESGSLVFCNDDIKIKDLRQKQLANRLPKVLYDLEANGFDVYFEPQINLKTRKMESVEALLRWNDPELGWVRPDEIFDMADARGWVGCITEWVLRRACRQAFIWQKAGYKIKVAVNISPSDLERQDAGLLTTIEEVFEEIKSELGEPGYDPNMLVLEITERVMVENAEQALQTMEKLRHPGISIHIDDFGTGTSGLKLLGDLPHVDVLKLDKSFLRKVGDDPGKGNPEHVKLIKAIINMAHEMGKKVITEGVETKEQLEFVRSLGCDIVQGYYTEEGLGAAMPAAELGKRLSLFADTTDEGGTTLGDYGFLVLAIIGSTLISKWLGLIVGLLAIYALVNFIAGADRTEPSGRISPRSVIFWVLAGIFAAGSAFAQVPGGENFTGALSLAGVTGFLWDNLVWVIIAAVEIACVGIAAFFLVWFYKYPVNWYLRKLKRGEFMHTRIYAIKQLGKIGDRRAIKPLIELMKRHDYAWADNPEFRVALAHALLSLSSYDLETVKKEFGEDYREVLFAYIEAYKDIKDYMLSLERDHIIRNEFEKVQKEFGVHAIPVLIDAMANGYDSAGISLIEIGEPAVEPLIKAFLDFPFVHPIFGQIPPEGDLSPDEKRLRDHRIRRAQVAIRVLGEIGDPRAIGPIKNMLLYTAKDFYDPRVTAVKALGKIGLSLKNNPRACGDHSADEMINDVTNTLITLLRGSVRPPTVFEMEELGGIMEPIRTEPDASERVRQEAADYLGKLGGERAFNALYEAFYSDKDQYVRRSAVQGMGEIGGEKAIAPIYAALNEADKGIRLDAVKALGKFGGSEAFKLLCGVFNDREDGIRGEAARSLLKLDEKALTEEFGPDFKKILKAHICVEEGDWKTMETLGKAAIPALRACLTDVLVRNYFSAVEALGKINVPPEEVIPILVSQLELKGDKYAGNRQIVIKTLGTIDAPRTIPILVNALTDENAAVRQTAAIALGQKAECLAVMSLEMNTTNHRAIWALAKILREDNDPNARKSAAQSLTKLAQAFKNRMGLSEERVKRIKQARRVWQCQAKEDPVDLVVCILTSMTVLAKDTGVRVAVINGLGEIGEPYYFISKELLSRLRSNYGNDSYWVHVASARALLRINHVEFLRENLGDDYEARLNAHDLIEQKKWQELEKMGEHALPALFDAMGSGVWSSYAANETAEKILGSSRISAEMFREIVRAIRHFHLIVLIHKNNPGLFNGSPLLKKLLEKIQFDLENKPEEERKKLLMQISNDITNYASEFDLEQNLDAVYESIYSLYIWVHDNLHLCLSSLINIGLKIDDISDLIKTLHINNPLTRVIRMLGESEVIIDGYQDVVSTVIAQGKFGHLYKLILQVAREKQRAAPQEVAGILGILREYNNRMQLAEWSDEAWTTFSRYVQEYYNSGFKVITSILFKYFTAHRNDKLKLDGLKVDIDKEMNNIGWGNYWGLSKKFKRKYNLTTADEIALMARFLQISNFSIKDYESIYESVKSSLKKKKPRKWQEEIPSSLRTLFSLRGTKPQTAYKPKDENEVRSLGELMNRLSSYASGSGLSTEDILEMDLSRQKEGIKPVIVRSALSEEERAYFQSIPEKAPERRAWLSRWYTLMADTLKLDQRAVLERKIEEVIKRRSAETGSLDDMLNKAGIRLVDISRMDKLFKVDPDIRKIISEGEYSELEEYFLRKWFIQMRHEDVKDPGVFNAWLERGFKKFISKIPHEINKARKKRREKEIEVEVDEQKIRKAVESARAQYLKNWQQFLSKRLSGRLVRIFSEDIGSVQRHLESFTEESVSSEENLYVGLFDDLLHLAGEFMMSGVCTRGDRPRQIAKGHGEGYHFATIALKDDLGRVLGFSQVQIIKTPITGKEDRENQGYRAIALTGINLSEKQLPIERERAVMAIIKAAQLLAEKAGLQGAVVVRSESIRSNQGDVNDFIDTLAQKGYLQEAKLAQKVHLSKRGLNLTGFAYSYKDVYFVDKLPEVELTTASDEELKAEQEKHEELLEKKHIEFFDRLGHIVQGKELTGEAATLLKEKMEEVLGTMPEDAIELVRMNMSLSGQAFNVIYEPTFAKSKVVHSKKEAVLYLGKDVLYSEGKTEELGLREALAEAIASFIVEDYERLKEAAQTDENAFFKLETIKALLNWQAHARLYHRFIHKYSWDTKNYWSERTPDEQEALASRYREDLDRFTDGWSRIRQHNIFMSVMDDADPMAMVFNYVHILSKDPGMTGKDIYRLIMDVNHAKIRDKASIARLRNVLKEFFFYGKVNIRKVDGKVDKKKKFDHFDDTAKIDQLKDILLTTGDINTFYRTLRSVLEMMLPLDEKSAEKDISAVFNKFGEKILTSDDREGIITGIVREALVRRLGAAAFTSLTEHLSANRGYKDIPYIEICPRELAEGADADEYEFLRYVPDVDGTYDLFSGEEKAPEDRDWVLGLFPVKAAPGEDDDNKGGHGTTLRDFGMLVVATAGASLISPGLGIVVGILACCVVVSHMTDMLGPSPAPQDDPSTGAGVNNERLPAPVGAKQIFEDSMGFGRIVSRLPDFIAKYILMFKRNSIQKKIRKTGIRWKKKNRALLPYGLEKELSVLVKDGKRRPGMEAPQIAAFEVAAMLNSELGFIIEKLLTNASDACMRKMNVDPDSSAKIDVRIFTAQSDLVIEITDNGPGLIDEAGSPLIRTLVKCHNGKVEWNNIASPDGVIEGAKATITLPLWEIVGVPDRLGIDHEITGDDPFIITKKAVSERSTPAAESRSISARAEPTIDELPSGIEEIIFNGERAGPDVVRRKISESTKGRVIFNAKIEEKRLILGFASEDNEHAHADIKCPGYGFGVFRGEIEMGEITLLLGGLDESHDPGLANRFRDYYIRIARIFVENGFPSSFPLDGMTLQALERCAVFEEAPKTIGELAGYLLSEELEKLVIRICKFQRQKDRIESPTGKELQEFIYKLNPHMQMAMKRRFSSVYPFTCVIATRAAKRIIEAKFGDLFDVSMRFGNFATKVGTHVWLIITDKKTGERYYLSFTDGQFVDFPLGDKQVVFFEKRVTSPVYQEWYEANGLEYATFKRIEDDSYAENALGMVEAEDQQAARKKSAIDSEPAGKSTKALLEELASIPELDLDNKMTDDRRPTTDESGATAELNSFLPLPILGFMDARILWAVVAALLFVIGIRIIWNEFKYAWSINSYREELKEKWSLESFFESKKKYDRWRKEQASREDGFVIEPLLDRLKELEKEVLESKESFHDVFEDLALKTYLLIRKEGSFSVDEWLNWTDEYIVLRAEILDNLIALCERDIRRAQLASKSVFVTDVTERLFRDRISEATNKLNAYKQLRDHIRSIDVRYALKIMDHLENHPGSFPGVVKIVDAEDPENVPLWRWQYLHPGKMPREKAAGAQTPADAPVPGKEPVRAAKIVDGWYRLAEMLEERLKGRQDSLKVLIWGYPGTGKSTIAEMIAKYGIGNISPDQIDAYVETGFIPILPEYRDSGKKLVIADGCDAPRWFKQHGMTPDVLVLLHIDENGDMNAEALAHSPVTSKAFYNVFKDDLGKDPHDPSTWDIIINTAGENALMALALDLKAQFAPADPGMSGPKSAGENEDKTEKTSEIPDNEDQKILRDLTDLEQLPLSLLELLVSLKFNKEVVLVFDESIGKLHDGKPLKKFMEAIEILKKNKRYEAILGRLKDPILVPVDRISAEAGKYAGRANTEVFVFAKGETKEDLKGLEGKGQVHTAFINENSMPQNAYYPLAEIVVITLAQSIAPTIINGKITSALKAAGLEIVLGDINIESIAKEGSALFFTLLPDAREYDHQELLQRYASFKRFLKAA